MSLLPFLILGVGAAFCGFLVACQDNSVMRAPRLVFLLSASARQFVAAMGHLGISTRLASERMRLLGEAIRSSRRVSIETVAATPREPPSATRDDDCHSSRLLDEPPGTYRLLGYRG